MPYHPQGNGACERMNQTIISMLNTLELREQLRWREHLPGLVHAYNNTPDSVTGLASFFVVFGRHARLPVDQAAGLVRLLQQVTLHDWSSSNSLQSSGCVYVGAVTDAAATTGLRAT